jgi:gliding motility-associated protein GldC
MVNKEIRINVNLDDKNIPEKIVWSADDSNITDMPVRAMLLSLWDHNNKDTLRLDLWTKEMSRDEMKIFFYETLKTMADTLERSVDDERIAGDMRDFCSYFAEKMDIIEDTGKQETPKNT